MLPICDEEFVPSNVKGSAMKKFIITLTDEAQASPERFIPQIEQSLGNAGCGNFQYMPTVGVIAVEFHKEIKLGGIFALPGIQSVEEDQECTTQHPLTIKDENGQPVGVFGSW